MGRKRQTKQGVYHAGIEAPHGLHAVCKVGALRQFSDPCDPCRTEGRGISVLCLGSHGDLFLSTTL